MTNGAALSSLPANTQQRMTSYRCAVGKNHHIQCAIPQLMIIDLAGRLGDELLGNRLLRPDETVYIQ